MRELFFRGAAYSIYTAAEHALSHPCQVPHVHDLGPTLNFSHSRCHYIKAPACLDSDLAMMHR